MILCLLSGATSAAVPHRDDVADRQPVSDITRTAEEFLERRIAKTGRQITPRAGRLDPRLRLARCNTALQGFSREGADPGSRTIVGVRCSGSNPWKVYVPVDLVEMQPVLVAKRALPRGHVLSEADFVAEQRDVARIAGAYIAEAGDAVGQRLKRPLVSGAVVSPSVLETQIVVKRGQTVTLIVRNASLNIRMAGKALMDGAVDERIRVENTVSKRVVEGFVRSPEYVEVLVR